jgi:hypothetical protein
MSGLAVLPDTSSGDRTEARVFADKDEEVPAQRAIASSSPRSASSPDSMAGFFRASTPFDVPSDAPSQESVEPIGDERIEGVRREPDRARRPPRTAEDPEA